MTKANSNEAWFNSLFRVAGYGLLALSVLDIIDTFVPPQFSNSSWELQLVTELVERAPVPLLGLVFVLIGEQSFRVFKFLSWACLLVGLLFVLLVPLTANSSFLIAQQNKQQVSSQLKQQTSQVEQLRTVISQAKTDEQINSILTRLNPRIRPPQSNNPQEVKKKLLAELAKGEKQLRQQAGENRVKAELLLLKNAVKLILGALFASTIFLVIWRKTNKMLRASRKR